MYLYPVACASLLPNTILREITEIWPDLNHYIGFQILIKISLVFRALSGFLNASIYGYLSYLKKESKKDLLVESNYSSAYTE